MLYDLAAASMGPRGQSGAGAALPELYTEGFDAEQIWLQLDLQVGALWAPCFSSIPQSTVQLWDALPAGLPCCFTEQQHALEQAGGALKRARKLMRRAGEVPSLVLPEMEEALDGELCDPPAVVASPQTLCTSYTPYSGVGSTCVGSTCVRLH